jgi:hypothetical protein
MTATLLRLRTLLLLPLFALLSCASTAPGIGGFAPPNGDWVLIVGSQTSSASYFSGSLTIQGESVSGVVTYNNPGTMCVSSSMPIAISGSINLTGTTMTLTTATFAGSVATITIQLPLITAAIPNFAEGTAVITGGSCALASTAALANYIDYSEGTVTNSFIGTLTNGTATGPATLTIPPVSANAEGQFIVTGAAIAFSSSSCSFSAANLNGLISGYTLQLSNSTITVTASAESSPIGISITGGCPGTLSGGVALQ